MEEDRSGSQSPQRTVALEEEEEEEEEEEKKKKKKKKVVVVVLMITWLEGRWIEFNKERKKFKKEREIEIF